MLDKRSAAGPLRRSHDPRDDSERHVQMQCRVRKPSHALYTPRGLAAILHPGPIQHSIRFSATLQRPSDNSESYHYIPSPLYHPMQKDESHDAGASDLPGLGHDASSGGFQLSAKLHDKLEKLAKWRIDQSSVEFTKDSPEFRGGNATVVKAFLASKSDGADREDQSDLAKSQSLDPGGAEAGTSRPRKLVAVKKMIISSERARVLGLTLREAGFLVDLSHENVIELEGFVEDLSNDIVWLVFPWEENGTLRNFIASADWEIPERISLIDDLARGVEHLHSRQPPIRHGDLKSINILVNSEYRAVITDFGSARRLTTKDLDKETRQTENKPQAALLLEATFCTSTNTMGITLTGDKYTLRWAPPEVLREEEPILESDIWALGWVAYEVMTNSIPFQDVTKDSIVIKRVVQGDLPSITDHARMSLIQALCSLMLACWSIDPRKRPTAEDCRKSINWMPMIVPNPIRTTGPAASVARPPALLIKLGSMYRRQGDYANALNFYNKALDEYRGMGNSQGKAEALVLLADVHRHQGGDSDAVTFYSEALQICTEIGDRQGRASALWGLAEVHRYREEYSQAVTLYSEGLQICTDIGDREGRVDALWGLAEVHRARAEYSQAVTLYSEILQIHTDIGDRRGSARALLGLAHVYRARDEYSQAVTFYSQVLQIRTDIGDKRGRADALRGLGEVHRLQNEYTQAITLNSEALEISTEIGDRYGKAQALLNLADAHHDQGNYSDAGRRYTEATEICQQLGDTLNADYASTQAAKTHQLSKRDQEETT